jgi:hypothetical protein
MGASILANNTGHYGAAAPAIGRGLQQGAGLYMANQEDPLQAQLRELQIQGAKAKIAQDEQDAIEVEKWISRLDPKMQQFARAFPEAAAKIVAQQQFGASGAQWGLQPQHYQDETGAWHEVRFASDGTSKDTKLNYVPFNVAKQQPEFIGEQAGARTGATERARLDQAFLEKYSPNIAQMQLAQQKVEQLAKLPGRISATGGSSMFRSIPGGDAADYEAAFEQLKGMNFLSMVPQMTGMGALSDAEGRAITAAASELSLSQSEEGHAMALSRLYTILDRGMERIRTRKLLGPGIEVSPPSDDDYKATYQRLFGSGAGKGSSGGWKIEKVQ